MGDDVPQSDSEKELLYKIITGDQDDMILEDGDNSLNEGKFTSEGRYICKRCRVNASISQDENLTTLCVKCITSSYLDQDGNEDNNKLSLDQHDHLSSSSSHDSDLDFDSLSQNLQDEDYNFNDVLQHQSMVEIAKYTPLRLTMEERKKLRILEAALNASEYTDKVDVLSSQRAKRMVAQIREMCSIIAGLIVATDYNMGQKLFQDRDYAHNVELYREIFEIGRRYKIMNPDKMRSSYGKLMYLLQDSINPNIHNVLNFTLDKPIKTVYLTLESLGHVDILSDDVLRLATACIESNNEHRDAIRQKIRKKEAAVKYLIWKYAGKKDPSHQDNVRDCIYSMSDYFSYVRANSGLCAEVIDSLKRYFTPDVNKNINRNLSITSGNNGSRLTHTHKKQYAYVLQSLTLWKEILKEMYKLWFFVDRDMLNDSALHRLVDTGQGLNRIQCAPNTLKNMSRILERTIKLVGTWVGSSVIHMGDENVPNALIFIDKYSQVHRILAPIVNVIKFVQSNSWRNTPLETYFDKLGSPDDVCATILSDFFCSAFDGSGANSYFTAGSCIDGRLTSAWNWCSLIHHKPYFPVFLLSGFTGFDGDWAF